MRSKKLKSREEFIFKIVYQFIEVIIQCVLVNKKGLSI